LQQIYVNIYTLLPYSQSYPKTLGNAILNNFHITSPEILYYILQGVDGDYD